MKHKIRVILTVSLMLAFFSGCGAKDTIYLEAAESGAGDLKEQGESAQGQEEKDLPEDVSDLAGELGETMTDASAAVDQGTLAEDKAGVTGAKSNESGGSGKYCVYLCGAVSVPGVYELAPGSRVYEAVALAGGMTENAEPAAVNQAETVSDGQMIYIPTQEEAAEAGFVPGNGSFAANGVNPGTPQGPDAGEAADSRVNLNTATAEQLMTLPGIGQAKADSILAYRSEHGSFSSVEEIMQVEGIKEGLYNRVKDHIRVKN